MNQKFLILSAALCLPLIVQADLPVRPGPRLFDSNTGSWGTPQDGFTPGSSVHAYHGAPDPNRDNVLPPDPGAPSTAGSGSSIRKQIETTISELPPPNSTDKGSKTGTNSGSGQTGSNPGNSQGAGSNSGQASNSGGSGGLNSGSSSGLNSGSGKGSGLNSGGSGGNGQSNDNTKGYDYLTKQDEAMAPQNPPGAPALPSKCMEEANCKKCFDDARAGMDKTRLNLEKVRGIYSYTHKFTTAGIAFMQGVANQAGGVAALGAQAEAFKVNGALDEFDKTVSAKNTELLGKLKVNLQEVAACEAEYYKNDDWFNRYGFTYYQFMQANYSYVQKPGL